jgi:hypothetical protein
VTSSALLTAAASGRGRGVCDTFGGLGYVVIAIFVLSWLGLVVFYHLKRYDRLEVNTAGEADASEMRPLPCGGG